MQVAQRSFPQDPSVGFEPLIRRSGGLQGFWAPQWYGRLLAFHAKKCWLSWLEGGINGEQRSMVTTLDSSHFVLTVKSGVVTWVQRDLGEIVGKACRRTVEGRVFVPFTISP